MKTLGIILIICGIIPIVRLFRMDVTPTALGEIIYIFSSLVLLLGVLLLGVYFSADKKTTDKDVLNGKAEYQETLHITETDTIKTYKIVWKPAER